VLVWPWLIAHGVRVVVSVVYLFASLGPVQRYFEASERASDAELLATMEVVRRAPMGISRVYGFGWLIAGLGFLAWSRVAGAEGSVGPGEVATGLLFVLGTFVASGTSTAPLAVWVFEHQRDALRDALAGRGLTLPVHTVSMERNLIVFHHTLLVGAVLVLAVPAWATHVTAQREIGIARMSGQLTADLARVGQGLAPVEATIVETDALAPPSSSAARDEVRSSYRVAIDRRTRIGSVAAELDDGRWLELRASLAAARDLPGQLLLFGLIILLWAPMAVILNVRVLVEPLRVLDEQMRRFVETGEPDEFEALGVMRDDEIGTLTRNFNAFIDGQRELAELARRVADGQLDVELSQPGAVNDAFLTMVEQLRVIVAQIRATTLDVGSVSSELLAATRQQQQHAEQTDESVRDIKLAMRELAAAAERIAASCDEVLQNAERSSTATDTTVAKIDELSREAGGVSELLDQISTIADRSDLLALNGSLEATRAGEAGRGFGLVAAEMRRLAERVTGTVADGRDRVASITATGSATLEVTEASRVSTSETAAAAREIAVLTRQQRDQTEGVSATVDNMAEFVSASTVATEQTGAAVESLRKRVEELERLTDRFS